jgi:hypothetical protein
MSIEKRPKYRSPKSKKKSKTVAYRKTEISWLIKLLTEGEIFPSPQYNFVSFSFSKLEGLSLMSFEGVPILEYGDVQIEFDLAMLQRQGAKPVDYDAIESGGAKLEIVEHVTGAGFEDEDDYYLEFDLEDADDARAKGEPTWEEYIDPFRQEEEIIMKKLTYEPGIIKKVILPKIYLNPRIKDLLDRHYIPYETYEGGGGRYDY